MTLQSIKRVVDVEIRKDTPRVSAVGFGILLIITNNPLLSIARRHKRFTTAESVNNFFGSNSEEAKAANAYFFQDPFNSKQPEELHFGKFANIDTSGFLECGDSPETDIEVWKAITDGEFKITIDATAYNIAGLDFSSVTSLVDIATVIDTALGVNGDCYFLINRFNFNSKTTGINSTITLLETVDTPAGTDISGINYLDGDIIQSVANPGGSYLSQGQVAEDFAIALAAIETANNDWYAMSAIKIFRDVSSSENMADEIENRRKVFLIATNDSNTTVLSNTSTFAYYLKNNNYRRTAVIYHDNADLYPDISWLGLQLPKDIGSTNWAYKILAGTLEGASVNITSVNLTEDQKDAVEDVNANFYSALLNANIIYPATMGGGKNIEKDGEYIDIIRNIDFLQARVEEGLLSLLIEKEIIPFTNAGIAIVDNRLKLLLQQHGVDQNILIAETIETFFPTRSEVSQEDRDNRKLPNGTFQAELKGAINTVIVRGTVYI